MQRIIERQNKVVITDRMWARLLSSTNQPSFLHPKHVSGEQNGTNPHIHLVSSSINENNAEMLKYSSEGINSHKPTKPA